MKDTYTLVTDRIIAELESGTIPWHRPWTCTQPAISHTTGKAYSLLNQLLIGGRGGEYRVLCEGEHYKDMMTIYTSICL